MPDPTSSPLSDLKVGDIFQFAQARKSKTIPGEHKPQWRVTSAGEIHCGVALEKTPGAVEIQTFNAAPMLLPSTTQVVKIEQAP